MESLGVKLGLFYKLLWRHVFAVELIKAKWSMRTESQQRTFMDTIWNLFGKGDKARKQAMDYLVQWGQRFWEDTQERVKEITTKLETEVKDSLGFKLAPLIEASSLDGEKLTIEQKADVVRHAQQAVDKIQVNKLW